MIFKTFLRMISRPFEAYNKLLETNPLFTKCVTSGVMYAGGDMIAQTTEYYQKKAKYKADIINRENNDNGNDNAQAIVAAQQEDNDSEFQMSWKRALVFFTFGNIIAGPSYHYWFNYLNELPTYIWQLKQTNQRYKILRAYATLKIHGIEVNLDLNKIPKAAKLSKWASKGAKIAADQLIFSSTYTLIFFLCIGIMNGAIEKYESEKRYEEYHNQMLFKKGKPLKEKVSETELDVEVDQRHFKTDMMKVEDDIEEKENYNHNNNNHNTTALNGDRDNIEQDGESLNNTDLIHNNDGDDDDDALDSEKYNNNNNNNNNNHFKKSHFNNNNNNNNNDNNINGINTITPNQRAVVTISQPESSSSSSSSSEQQQMNDDIMIQPPPIITWDEIWVKTWTHTKSVYLPTYFADCIVWPPIQLINFTFVPVRFQFLYVNFANLAWNTYLSLMANNGGGGHGGGGSGSSSSSSSDNSNRHDDKNRSTSSSSSSLTSSSSSSSLAKLNPTSNIIMNRQQQQTQQQQGNDRAAKQQ